jgi:hypothetical protein
MHSSAMTARTAAAVVGLGLCILPSESRAQAQQPPTPRFDVVGFIQEATVEPAPGSALPADPLLLGGTLTVNGIRMIVPNNTLVQMPAATFTWAQLFDPAVSAPVPGGTPWQTAGEMGLALKDSPRAFPSFQVHAIGNVLTDPGTGELRYIVGLILPIQQQPLTGAGAINHIDYATGRFRVGGRPGDPTSGTLVEINDPVGRFGLAHSPDPRFSADTANATVHASTGYPMGIPRVAPPALDPLCPLGNRPLNGDARFPTNTFQALGVPLKGFDMLRPANGVYPDARQQAPLMVGDWVAYQGTLYKLDPAGLNTAANMYVSAHSVEASVAIYTAPGVPPCYVTVTEMVLGVGGPEIAGIEQEAITPLIVQGMTTDPTTIMEIFAIDVNPVSGVETLRLLATADPGAQPVRGHFDVDFLGGRFLPPTRELLVRSRTGVVTTVANGLGAGQYRLPHFEFVFPANLQPIDPLLPANFQDFPFLAQGSGPLGGTGPLVGQLDPWPGEVLPGRVTAIGAVPAVDAGPDITVRSVARVNLAGTVTLDPGSAGVRYSWVQTGGEGVAVSGLDTPTATFSAPNVFVGAPDKVLTFRLTATDAFGSHSDSVTVTVTARSDDVVISSATWSAAGGSLSVSASSTVPTAVLTALVVMPDSSVRRMGVMNAAGGVYTLNATLLTTPYRVVVRSDLGGAARQEVTLQ